MAEKTKSPLKKKKSGFGILFNTGAVDLYFLILVLILLAVGLVMLFSASYPYAYYNNDGDSLFYFRKQLFFAVSGIVIMMVVSKIKYGWFKVLTYPLLAITTVALIIVLFLPDLPDTPGFKRWLYIPGTNLPTFQPSELAKIALVMFCAVKMEQNHKKLAEKPFAFWPYALVTLVFAGLIYLENHVSGTVLIIMIGVVMMYLGGTKKYWFYIGIVAVVAVVALVILKPDILPEHAQGRITLWLDKEAEPTKGRWQTNQSLYAISSGGLFGVGLGQSKQKHLYVSEPQNDFIFSIVCEELGLFGACVIIILFVLLIARGVAIALKAKDRFGSLLVLGVVFHIGMQVALNIGVVTDFLPNTGISLPFFSAGGTALWVLLGELGMVLSVSRSSSVKKV